MCGRYAASKDTAALVEEFEIDDVVQAAPPASYNVAPTDVVPIVVERPPKDGDPVRRQLRTARWGLVPSWAKDVTVGAKMINARWESLAKQPAYRKAFARRRAVLPADGYYEWQRTSQGKQPFYVHRADGKPLALAGLFEFWRPNADSPWLVSAVVITTDATARMAPIHDRMPVLLPPELIARWLDPTKSFAGDVPGLDEEMLVADPVGRAVNSVRNNSAALIEPVVPSD